MKSIMEFWKAVLKHYVTVVVSGGICHIFHGKNIPGMCSTLSITCLSGHDKCSKKTPQHWHWYEFFIDFYQTRNRPSSGAWPRFLLEITIFGLFSFSPQIYYRMERNTNRPDLTEMAHISITKIKNKSRKTIIYNFLCFHFLICLRSCSNNWDLWDFDKILFSGICKAEKGITTVANIWILFYSSLSLCLTCFNIKYFWLCS